ncbi:class I SAM-dependent methyltransferase [Luteimonas marina]|uniref:Class I SAM-dependent methyltransferase n=1 Tax=Luteimonas marina TaxID=488485 RepID=A0A5C5U8U0_9GAMM|nr:class I SAM-dependent methyltransferase [Luteimonas marina]TWT22337.1 class I SAM-dependent methyltransferase [Luteimonas marina]
MAAIHDSAAGGYAQAAGRYASGRPGYPEETAHWLHDVVGLAPGRSVLDLGAGTGKFVPRLLATGARVVAVEPVAAMRVEFACRHPDVELHGGTAEAIPLADASMDAVVCAQSFHWFATARALSGIRRVLLPGGVLGLVWNVRDETVPWVAALSAITNAHEAGTPRYHSGEWRGVLPGDGFTLVDDRTVRSAHVGAPEQVIVQRTLSVSFIAALPAAQRDEVERQVRALVAATPELAGAPEVAFPYRTRMIALRRRDDGT